MKNETKANPVTCMVVDDDLSMRRHIRHILEKMNLVVIEAENGAEAVETFQKSNVPPSIILMDQTMPVMDGLTALKLIKSLCNRTIRTKVIMVTALGTYNLGVDAIKNGASDFIVKPFQPILLEHAVKTALNQIKLDRIEEKKQRDEIELRTVIRAGVSLKHEINSPLQAITTAMRLIVEGREVTANADKVRQFVNDIRDVLEKFSETTHVKTTDYQSDTKMLDIDGSDAET